MRIEMRKRWRRVAWVGPEGEQGHGSWRQYDQFAQDRAWCDTMNALYPGWVHTIEENLGAPREQTPEGLELHPLYGDMKRGPMGL